MYSIQVANNNDLNINCYNDSFCHLDSLLRRPMADTFKHFALYILGCGRNDLVIFYRYNEIS